jgi:hypothetical protein
MREKRGAYRVLVGKPEEKIPLGRPRCRWEDNIKMYLREVRWDMQWIDLAQDMYRWGGCCKCDDKPSGSIKCGEFPD